MTRALALKQNGGKPRFSRESSKESIRKQDGGKPRFLRESSKESIRKQDGGKTKMFLSFERI